MNEFIEHSDATGAAGAETPNSRSSLPFDPARILSALLCRWRWILLSTVLLGLAAAGVSYHQNESIRICSGQFLRQDASDPVHSSDTGYRPSPISAATLESLMNSPVIMDRAEARTKIPNAPLAKHLAVTAERGTDIIDVTYRSSLAEDEAMRVLTVYGEEVLRLTKELTSEEAADANKVLQRQLAEIGADLAKANAEMVKFYKVSGSINLDKEMEAYLKELTDLDSRSQIAQIDYETTDLRIDVLKKELLSLNGIQERLRVAREHLADLQRTYSDQHPEVLEQKDYIADLESKADAVARGTAPMPKPTESGAASGIYQDLVEAKAQKEALGSQAKKLKSARDVMMAKLHNLSDATLQYTDLQSRRQALEATQTTLVSRQREAALYEETGLINYRFIPGKSTGLGKAALIKKAALNLILGGLIGMILSVGGLAVREMTDRKVRTAADARRALNVEVLSVLRSLDDTRSWAFRVWTAIQSGLEGRPPCIGIASASSAEGRSTLVNLFGDAAALRTKKVISISNSAAASEVDPLPLEAVLENPSAIVKEKPVWIKTPPDWEWNYAQRHELAAAVKEWAVRGFIVLIELPPASDPAATILAESCTAVVWVVESGRSIGKTLAEAVKPFKSPQCNILGAVLNRAPCLIDPFGLERLPS